MREGRWEPPWLAQMSSPDRILFIDAEAIVLDKPAGLPVDAPRRGGDSIVARIDELKCGFQRPPTADAPARHRHQRLSAVCAHAPKRERASSRRSRRGAVEKYYLAVVDGEIGEEQGIIDVPLAKISSAEAGWKMVADHHGLEATTRWRRLAIRDGSTLVEFRPVTGRTHQIRAHAREAFGRGIVGDRVYGVPGGPMLLHASRLVVPREAKPAIDVTAPLPEYFGDWGDAA